MLHSVCSRRFVKHFLLLSRTKFLISPPSQCFSTNPGSIFDPETPPDPPNFNPATVRETLTSYCNDWKRAYEFFTWIESESKSQSKFNHTTETFNRMIDILGKFFEFDLSWSLIQRMKQNPSSFPDHTTFRILFKRYVSAHLVKEAIDCYERLDEFNLKDETSYCYLIDALCEYKHVAEAQELCFGKGNDKNLSTKVYNMILRGWGKMAWWSNCRDFWVEMDKKNVHKDLHSYSIYMDIECKRGKPWNAVKWYKEMKRKGIRLDVVAYNTVIRAIGLSQGVDFAIRVFREMKDLGCEPDVASYNTVIKLLCENGRYREAHALLDQLLKKKEKNEGNYFPDVITYHCFFRCLEKPREILLLFDNMIESGIRPRMDTYVMIMRKFGRWGFLRPVFTVWNKMGELGCSPDESAYNALIDALVDKGMVDLARKYDDEMFAKGLSPKPRKDLGTKLEL